GVEARQVGGSAADAEPAADDVAGREARRAEDDTTVETRDGRPARAVPLGDEVAGGNQIAGGEDAIGGTARQRKHVAVELAGADRTPARSVPAVDVAQAAGDHAVAAVGREREHGVARPGTERLPGGAVELHRVGSRSSDVEVTAQDDVAVVG